MIKCYLGKGKFTIRTVYHKLFEILNDDTCTGDIECSNIILPKYRGIDDALISSLIICANSLV